MSQVCIQMSSTGSMPNLASAEISLTSSAPREYVLVGYGVSDGICSCNGGPPVFVSGQKVEVGKCCPQDHQAWWNPVVAKVVYSTSGMLVELSDNAVNSIKQKYTGKPLYVKIRCKCVPARQPAGMLGVTLVE